MGGNKLGTEINEGVMWHPLLGCVHYYVDTYTTTTPAQTHENKHNLK